MHVSSSARSRPLPAFTLIELLVVVAILLTLAALGFRGASQAILSAKMSQNMAKLRDLGGVFGTYASDYGHYPPGWDSSYGEGPLTRDGAPMHGRGPDLVNAYREFWDLNDTWLSPVVGGRLIGYEGDRQPTNYTGHPVLCYNGGDQSDPVPAQVVTRPGETFLLCDGIPKDPAEVEDPASSKNAQTGMRQWYRFRDVSDPRRAEAPLPVTRSSGRDSNGPDFRNNGRCHVLFVDGSVRALQPADFKVKMVTLGY